MYINTYFFIIIMYLSCHRPSTNSTLSARIKNISHCSSPCSMLQQTNFKCNPTKKHFIIIIISLRLPTDRKTFRRYESFSILRSFLYIDMSLSHLVFTSKECMIAHRYSTILIHTPESV